MSKEESGGNLNTIQKIQKTLLVTLMLLLTHPIFAADLTVNYSITGSGSANQPIPAEVRLYDEHYNELSENFALTNQSSYVSESPSNLHSGDTIKIGKDSGVTITNLPEKTKYRLIAHDIPASDVKIDNPVIQGEVSDNPAQTFNGKIIYSNPTALIPFKTILPEGSFPDASFTYTLTPTEGQDNITYTDNPVTFSGAGLYIIPVEFKKKGTAKFTLSQTAVTGGLTKDESTHEIEITYSEDSANENMLVTVKIDGKPLETPPEYTPGSASVTFSPEISKILNGKEVNQENFKFTLTSQNDDPSSYTLPVNTTITTKANETGSFDPISFHKTGTYHFTISEMSESSPGYSYDTGQWDLEVKVTDDDTGLKIAESKYLKSGTSADKATFTNTYSSGTLSIHKIVVGKDDESRDFDFLLTLTDEEDTPLTFDYPAAGVDTISTVKSGEAFKLKADETIKISGLPEGAKYNLKEQNLPHGYTSRISEESGTITKDQEVTVTATNTYTPAPATYTPQVKKEIVGDYKVAGDFHFTIENKNADESVVLPEELTISGANEGSFSPITINKAGTYTFLIKERAEDNPNFTYDKETVELTLVVTDNDGTLTVSDAKYTKESSESDKAVFTNTYSPQETSFTPKVKKQVTGDPPEAYYDFNFTLEEKAPESPGDDVTEPRSAHIGAGETQADFDAINFTTPGTYSYIIKETPGTFSYDYDATEILLEVTVTDVEGSLTATGVYKRGSEFTEELNEGAVFTNTYNSGTLKISKEVVGKEDQSPFDFKINFTEGEIPSSATFKVEGVSSPQTLKNDDTFSLAHGESLTIKGLPIGIKYTITEENVPYGYTPTYEGEASGTITGAEEVTVKCINTYKPDATEYTPLITKEITGEPTVESTFNFTLIPKPDNPPGDDVETSLTGTVTGEGDVTIPPVHYTASGTFSYDITETPGGLACYTNDSSTWELVVTVSDSGGKLGISNATYSKAGSESADKATFVNIYTPAPVSTTPKVNKVINGTPAGSPVFNFNLTATEDTQSGYSLSEITTSVAGQGEASFGMITFSTPGTYTFEIKETQGAEPGYTYDTSTWIYTVTVTDSGGNLSVAEDYRLKEDSLISRLSESVGNLFNTKVEAAERSADFKNTYLSGNLKISKKVLGDSLSEFPFHLKLSDNTGLPLDDSYHTNKDLFVTSETDFNLKSDDSLEIYGLPKGAAYEVTEGDVPGFRAENQSFSGTISENTTTEVNFINHPENTGEIHVTKKVNGVSYDTFDFTLNLKDSQGTPLIGSFSLGEGGSIQSGGCFSLKKDESVTIAGIPYGTSFEITEAEKEGYESRAEGNTGVISDTPGEVVFTNTPTGLTALKNVIPQTGDPLYITGIIATGCFIIYLIIRLKLKSRRKPSS